MPGMAGLIGSRLSSRDLEPFIEAHLHERYYEVTPMPPQSGCLIAGISNGSQPQWVGHASLGGITAFYCGDFYDTGVRPSGSTAAWLIDQYRDHGDRVGAVLDGSFVGCIIDSRAVSDSDGTPPKVLLFNDHAGSVPLYYATIDGALAFSPELMPIAALPGADRALNPEAFISLLVIGQLLGSQTHYRSIRPLLPGTTLRFEGGAPVITRHFHYQPNASGADPGEESCIETLSELLRSAIRKRLGPVERDIFCLSGGVDSRAIAAIVGQLTGERPATVTWGITEDRPGGDAEVARAVARLLQTRHTFVTRGSTSFAAGLDEMVRRIDGTTDDPAEHPSELDIVRSLREELGMQRIWRGEECFGVRPEPASRRAGIITAGVQSLGMSPNVQGILRQPFRQEMLAASESHLEKLTTECRSQHPTDLRDYLYFSQRWFHYHTRSTYYKWTAMNAVSPWTDRTILSFVSTLPNRYRDDKYLFRTTLRRMFPDVMAIPLAIRGNLENWPETLKNDRDMQRYIRGHLLEQPSAMQQWLDRDAVERLLDSVFMKSAATSRRSLALAANTWFRKIAPGLQSKVKAAFRGKVNLYSAHRHAVVFRLLVYKRWLDLRHQTSEAPARPRETDLPIRVADSPLEFEKPRESVAEGR